MTGVSFQTIYRPQNYVQLPGRSFARAPRKGTPPFRGRRGVSRHAGAAQRVCRRARVVSTTYARSAACLIPEDDPALAGGSRVAFFGLGRTRRLRAPVLALGGSPAALRRLLDLLDPDQYTPSARPVSPPSVRDSHMHAPRQEPASLSRAASERDLGRMVYTGGGGPEWLFPVPAR